MTAHRVAVACGMAVLAMGAMEPAAAFDDQRTGGFDRTVAMDGGLTDQGVAVVGSDFDRRDDVTVLDRLDDRTSGFSRHRARGEQSRSIFTPYAGIGIDKLKLSMDLESGKMVLKKDKGFTRTRLILGMGYAVTEDLSLGLEYRALASDQPLFSLDVGSETLDLDTRFNRHNFLLTASYSF